jgi:hypothetical protein
MWWGLTGFYKEVACFRRGSSNSMGKAGGWQGSIMGIARGKREKWGYDGSCGAESAQAFFDCSVKASPDWPVCPQLSNHWASASKSNCRSALISDPTILC